jgi:hypothetical protein
MTANVIARLNYVTTKYNILLCTLLIASGMLTSICTFAQPGLQRCADIQDDATRLKCYDELARPTEKSFGLEQKVAPTEEAAETIDNVVAKVTSATHNDITGWTINFDNGQSWKQVGIDRFNVKEGVSCTISRGALNSFRLQCGNIERRIQVTRSQ